ncbi:MAG TPA: hypothetical protein VLA84_19315 [Microcoleus sp.]|nr:hypothetical protein [Microcoleus sp.]
MKILKNTCFEKTWLKIPLRNLCRPIDRAARVSSVGTTCTAEAVDRLEGAGDRANPGDRLVDKKP